MGSVCSRQPPERSARRRPARPPPGQGHRGPRAEALASGGGTINPRFPNFAEEFLRIRPTWIPSWGLAGADGTTPDEFRVNARSVG